MTLSVDREERVRRAFAALVDMTPVGADLEEITEGHLTPPRRQWPGPAVMAIAVIATLAVLAPLILLGDRVGPPSGIPEDAPPPGSVAPFLDAPPGWFGVPVAGEREAADRLGRWVSAAIGVESGGQVISPVSVGVTDGTLRGLEDAEDIVVDGHTLRSLTLGGWQALATVDTPTIVVSGAVDTALLADVIGATTIVTTTAGDSLSISRLPDGYVERVPPQLHAEDAPLRRTLTNAASDISINEVSDWVEPELAAAGSGADYQHVEVNGIEGWTGRTEFSSSGPLTFLVWSPQPGVVLEIVTTNDDRTIVELVELAAATSVVSATE